MKNKKIRPSSVRVGQKRGFCENPTFTEKFGTPVEFEGPGFADSVPVDNNNSKNSCFYPYIARASAKSEPKSYCRLQKTDKYWLNLIHSPI